MTRHSRPSLVRMWGHVLVFGMLAAGTARSLPAVATAPGGHAESRPSVDAPGRRFAFLIGITDYPSTFLMQLDHAQADAQAVYKALVHPDLAAYHKRNVYMLLGKSATRLAIARVFEQELIPRLQVQDSLVFYYSGYGVVDTAQAPASPAESAAPSDAPAEPGAPPDAAPDRDAGAPKPVRPKDAGTPRAYLLPANAELTSLVTDGVGLDQLADWLSKVKARRRLILIDAGFSGQNPSAKGRTALAATCRPAELDNALLAPLEKLGDGAVVLCAGAVGQPARDDPESGHGLMTTCVLRGLVGRADMDLDGQVDARELLMYTEYALAERTGELGVSQRAWEQGRANSEGTVIARVHPRLVRQRARVRRFADAELALGGMPREKGGPVWPAGARRPAAVQRERYYVDYQPTETLPLEELAKARGDEAVYAQVARFDQHEAIDLDDGFNVARGGQVLAVALSRQLEKAGLSVGLELRPGLRARVAREFPAVDVSTFRVRLRVTGTVQFTVEHSHKDEKYVTEARLDTSVFIYGQADGAEIGVFQKRIRTHAQSHGPTYASRGSRALDVARQAVEKWVAALLGAPGLQPSLIYYLKRVTAD